MLGVRAMAHAVVEVGQTHCREPLASAVNTAEQALRTRLRRFDSHSLITRLREVGVRPDSRGVAAAGIRRTLLEQTARASEMSLSVIRQCRPTLRPGKAPARSFSINHRSDGAPIRTAASPLEYVRLDVDTKDPF